MASELQSVEYWENEGPVHRSSFSPNTLIASVDGSQTLWDALAPSQKQHANRPMLGFRKKTPKGWSEYNWITYSQAFTKSAHFASGLRNLGVLTGRRIGIFSQNNPQWVMTLLACVSQGVTFVPLYATLGPDAVEYISNHAEISAAVVDPTSLPQMIEALPGINKLTHIILTEAVTPMPKVPNNIRVLTFDQVVDIGIAEGPCGDHLPSPEDLFVIMYTSGTTGLPKGVMLTHRNVIASMSAMSTSSILVTPEDVHLSYLPMAHIFEMVIMSHTLRMGAAIGFWHGVTTELVDDIQALRPTILVGVPRVWNRIYDKITSQIQQGSFIKRGLFNYAFASKRASLAATGKDDSMWNPIVFAKIKEALGGRCRIIITGAAPLSAKVHEFMRVCFGCPVLQGYGLTETTAMATCQRQEDLDYGHVGAPQTCCEIKLVDVPEMGYVTKPGLPQRGEVCLRGPHIFKGYFKNPEKTAEVLEADGWFHTGDVGEWLKNGTLKIIDRKKNIFKLAQGEYVAAEKLETAYLQSPFIAQMFVYGDSFQPYLVAICVLDPDYLLPWAKSKGISETDVEALAKSQIVKQAVYADIVRVAQITKMRGFEFIKNIHLEPKVWAPETGELTPTMKQKRPILKKKYADIIAALYDSPRLDRSASKL